MFTGLIETTGTIVSVTLSAGGTRITVSAPESLISRLQTGDSVAVSGTCLTALAITSAEFSADLAQETLDRTTLGRLQAGATVNLELPTPRRITARRPRRARARRRHRHPARARSPPSRPPAFKRLAPRHLHLARARTQRRPAGLHHHRGHLTHSRPPAPHPRGRAGRGRHHPAHL